MGQAFRRATGRIGGSRVGTTTQLGKPIDRSPSSVPVDKVSTESTASGSESADSASSLNMETVLENRDPQFDAMLSQMVGRFQSKPVGKLEMGKASVVEKYKRPLPKLRNTTVDSGRYEEKPAPPGTLNVAQIRQIILLHQGKSEEHHGPMDVPQISKLFQIDVAQVQNILQFVALPPQDDSKKESNQE